MSSLEVKKYVFTCDACGNTNISDDEGDVPYSWSVMSFRLSGQPVDETTQGKDLCEHCTDSFKEWIRDRS